MTKTARIVYLILFFAVLFLLNYWLTGSADIPTGDTAIWLHAGLFMIVIGAYWVERFFTKPSDVVVNSLVAFVSVSTLTDPPYAEWWAAIRYGSLLLLLFSFAVMLFGLPQSAKRDQPVVVQVLYDLTVRLGNAKVLFSSIFVLALLSYFDLGDHRTKWFVLAWLAMLLASELRIAQIISLVLSRKRKYATQHVGSITRFVEPNIVRLSVLDGAECKSGTLIAFTTQGEATLDSPLGYVLHHRRTVDSIEAEAMLLDVGFKDGALDERVNAVSIHPENPLFAERVARSSLYARRDCTVGYVKAGSNIGRLEFEVVGRNILEEGHVVSVCARDKNVCFQITDASVKEEAGLEGSRRSYTIAGAEQLGTWNDEKQGFVTYSWAPPENSPVFGISVGSSSVENRSVEETIGFVPNSGFPVQIDLSELVLYHSAILGVTGSGKSFLAYALIEQCASQGIKVLCLDVTGDYKRYLRGAVVLPLQGHVTQFLEASDAESIGIIEFTEQSHPIQATQKIVELAKRWCQVSRKDEEFITPTAKVLIVLEEAHTLVPEWNFNPQRNLQDIVSTTAQAVLQARKYGLGFCVVTQRTANVTKSILNQCNTIFSFQAFDETGFDFLKNYMGDHYVRALPNLRPRHGILVGKASKSVKPLIVRFNDQARKLREEAAAVWVDRRERKQEGQDAASDTARVNGE